MEIDKEYLKKIIAETICEFDDQLLVKVGVSNRHIHLSQEDVDILFGKGYQLTFFKELLQPGQYACEECVTLIGPKGQLEKVRILGPVRKETQVEISVSDGFQIGVKPEICESGDLSRAKKVTIKNPLTNNSVESNSVIGAKRHIHMPQNVAEKWNLKDKDLVSVEIGGDRSFILNNVLVRASKDFKLEFHIDTDEANAGLVKSGDFVKVLL